MTLEDLAFYVKTYGTVLCFLVLSSLAIWSPRVKRSWLRWSLRVTGVVALVPTSIALLLPLLIPKYVRVFKLPSPDGRFTCYVKEGGSAATDDWTSITVRRASRPFAQAVYFTDGGFDPHVRWNDAKSLSIRFPEGARPTTCEPSYDGVTIVCQSAPEKEFYPMEQSR